MIMKNGIAALKRKKIHVCVKNLKNIIVSLKIQEKEYLLNALFLLSSRIDK